jgi:alpha-tubulin suppressor-like RCC1 family protein
MRGRLAGLSLAALFVAVACTGEDPDTVSPGGSSGGTGLGASCATSPCTAGVCVDGVCCESSCAGACEACNAQGRCEARTGAPKPGTCDGDATGPCAGTCDGKERAKCTYPTTQCRAGTCADGRATASVSCSAGTCPDPPSSQKCSVACAADGAACLDIVQVAAGTTHACALLANGTVRCWGGNDFGQVGLTGINPVKSPTEVAGLGIVKAIAASQTSTCALLSDATVQCWGSNTSGQLGRGGSVDSVPHPSPGAVPSLSGVTFIRGSSGDHFCAIVADGGIQCWGANGDGQLGNGASLPAAPQTTPVAVCAVAGAAPCTALVGAKFVTGGDRHTCAVVAQDRVACWGANDTKQLGRTTAGSAPDASPGFVNPEVTAKVVTAGNGISCAVDLTGAAKCWGTDGFSTLGNAQSGGQLQPPISVCTTQDCAARLSAVTAVSTFDESSCAVAGGAVKCWGNQLGNGAPSTTTQSFAGSVAVAKGARDVTSAGFANFAIVDDGANHDVVCWGKEASYFLCAQGIASEDRASPIPVAWAPP